MRCQKDLKSTKMESTGSKINSRRNLMQNAEKVQVKWYC